MAVHPSSVIPTWVNDYKATFYDSLTSQEDFSFLSDFAFWQPEFQKIATALNNWKAGGGTSRTSMTEFMIRFMTYISVGLQFPSVFTYNSNLADAYTIYSINNFMVDTEGRANNYYNDKTETGPGTGVFYSPRIDAAVAQINGWSAPEVSLFNTLLSESTNAGIAVVSASLFEDPAVVPKTKQDFAVEIFTTRNWKKANDTLSLGLSVPPYI